ncbi:hypothetical protein BGZ49_010162 [Haplosporangium sp. Z 27]|nr:hypothetical protein BGZ49_010162 [Haplosporangium sp. Z 27]
MNYGSLSQDLHVAIVPEVTVEFETIEEGDEVTDIEQPAQSSISQVNPKIFSDETDKQVDKVDDETSDIIYIDTEEQLNDEGEKDKSSSPKKSESYKNLDFDSDILEGEFKKGHSRILNPSSGSDLIQVSVEDLLVSEEMVRTIKSNKSNRRYGHQEQEQGQDDQSAIRPTPSISSSSSSSSTRTMTTVTATIRATGERSRSIVFDDDLNFGTSKQQQHQVKENQDLEKASQRKGGQRRRVSSPPAPKTPAQQREAEADDNIQKAIELHENNQLEEATHYFKLAAQSENPLGQLMFGLSLRHGWGCKPNPTEAIIYLQRAAEYAMGELNELKPIGITVQPQQLEPLSTSLTSSTPSDEKQLTLSQQELGGSEKNTNFKSKPTSHQTLRRMGSMDRKEAMAMARKELVMALYELGMSYLKGWGVAKDKSVGFTYFKIAADLGDADSQNETAMCYYEGIGVEKDMYESAKYYRMAASQGSTQLGNSWIWKPKYDQYCAAESAGIAAGTGMKKSQGRPRRLSAVIHTVFHGGSTIGKSGGGKEEGSPLSPPVSPTSIDNRNISSIASELATADTVVIPKHSNTSRQSLVSPPSTPPISASASSRPPSLSTSIGTGVSPTSPISPISPTSSLKSSLRPKSFVAGSSSQTSPTTPSPLSSVVSNTTGEIEKKKNRWTMWGALRSTTSPPVVTPQ